MPTLTLHRKALIAKYPEFSKLDIKQKPVFDKFSHKHGYYCDFNFANLFSWNIEDDVCVATLNNNLILKRQDYVAGKYFYSILGNHKIDDSLVKLLSEVKVLNFVPEIVVDSIKKKEKFEIEPERDNYDYIFNVKELIELRGKKHKNARNRLNKFKKEFEDYDKLSVTTTSVVDLHKFKTFQEVFYTWKDGKGLTEDKVEREKKALNRLLKNSKDLNLLIVDIKL
ncbi:MAG TPA: phosphatidylglycerol lysyltransferase domain-containing protein, partial [Tenuifilaceae bacterium]|nr:phosphatidylglycerol lysyltransferase domain-containing protein [Tenuifilaceae bacterium]